MLTAPPSVHLPACAARLLIGAALALAVAAPAHADRRYYVRSYQYVTQDPGALEVEWYLELDDKRFEDSTGDKWTHQLELEYGILDRWDASLYAVFRQPAGAGLSFDQVKLRTRYRLFERGDLPVDVLLYLEYKLPTDLRKGSVFEEKIVLARDVGRFNAALNLIAEQEWHKRDGELRHEIGYTAGASYELAPAARVGAEVFGRVVPDVNAWVGPVVSVGSGAKWWLSAGVGFGLTDNSDQFRFRSILGIYL